MFGGHPWYSHYVASIHGYTHNALLIQAAKIAGGRGGLPVVLALHRILSPVGHNPYGSPGIAGGSGTPAWRKRDEGSKVRNDFLIALDIIPLCV